MEREEEHMSRVALVVTLKIADGKMDAFMTAVKAHAARCLMNEEGCLQFDVLLPEDRPGEVRLYEVYRDQAALDEHANGASIKQMRSDTEGMVASSELVKCLPQN